VTDTSKNALNSTGLLRHSTPITALRHYTRAQKDSIKAALQTAEEMATRKETIQFRFDQRAAAAFFRRFAESCLGRSKVGSAASWYKPAFLRCFVVCQEELSLLQWIDPASMAVASAVSLCALRVALALLFCHTASFADEPRRLLVKRPHRGSPLSLARDTH
jgi:hypothetical protein